MNWKKRKKQRKIAHHYGFAHYYEYKRSMKFCIYYNAFEHALDNGSIHWSEVLPRMNQMLCKAGLSEYCMTQEEWYAKVMAKHNELEEELARKEDEMVIRFINEHYSTQSIVVDKPTNIIVKQNFGDALEQIHSDIEKICDHNKSERLGFVDYIGITKIKPELKGWCLTLEDLDNGKDNPNV